VLYKNLRNQNIFGKPARKPLFDLRALRIVSVLAIKTFQARYFRSDKYPVAQFIFIDGIAEGDNLCSYFVPLHQRRSRETVPFNDIAAADAAGNNLDQYLLRAGFRSRYFFDPDILVIVPVGNFHC
jgi:hypothetical protein